MIRQAIVLAGILVFSAFGSAQAAQWVPLSKGLDDPDIRAIAVHPRDAAVIFAGSERRVYRSLDAGSSWKQVLSVRGGANSVKFIYTDPESPGTVYVATDAGVQRSTDGGKRWTQIFKGVGKAGKIVHSLAADVQDPRRLWIGTGEGLFYFDSQTNHSTKAEGLASQPVYSVLPNHQALFVATADGIYRRKYGTEGWDSVFSKPDSTRKGEGKEPLEPSLEQFDIEELSRGPFFSNLLFLRSQDKLYAATERGILEGSPDGASWNPIKGQSLPELKINYLAGSTRTIYAATDTGVFQWDAASQNFREIYKGLASKKIRTLHYSASGDYLLAATEGGLFKLAYPELGSTLFERPLAVELKPREVLERFAEEPSVEAIQQAAIRYAEVHPDKIEGWRKAASRKAFLPKVSFDYDLSRDQTIDLDRGGTADPDVYIMGPEEQSRGWSVGVSWDLGDLIWNDDQTSIDTRSRLMVELRDDILTQVTHLYFERRRLQVEMALAPMRDLPVQLEKEIRLQELTAGIDALTDGYLSRRLSSESQRS